MRIAAVPRSAKHGIGAAQMDQIAVQPPQRTVGVAFLVEQLASLERARDRADAGIRSCMAGWASPGNCVRNCRRPASTAVGELAVVIGEVGERRRRSELLPLKQHRQGRTEQQQRGQRAPQGAVDVLVQTRAEPGVGDLVVIFEKA